MSFFTHTHANVCTQFICICVYVLYAYTMQTDILNTILNSGLGQRNLTLATKKGQKWLLPSDARLTHVSLVTGVALAASLQCGDPPHQSQLKYTPISHSLPHVHTDSLDCRGRHLTVLCIHLQHRHAHIWSHSPVCGKCCTETTHTAPHLAHMLLSNMSYTLYFDLTCPPPPRLWSHTSVHTRLNSL